MISSTARDLPEHREQVMQACMRLGMLHPDMMEFLTATDATALEGSLDMVNHADIYVGVFAFRYGYVPDGQTTSITEAEYNRAVEREIPRLIFLMSDEHDVKPGDVETGEGAEKLQKLKERLKKEQIVGFFDSADDLKAQVIQALVDYREPDLTAFHYVSDIPAPPEVYIAHPYTLLQARGLVGRQDELNMLTDWVAKPDSEIYKARILNVIAIGGMGKSALTWKWFNDIAPQAMKPLAGRVWWTFYESDARYENFIYRALAYVTKQQREEVEKLPLPECEEKLLAALDREPFLIVLDGMERLLIAYARMDAARLSDSDLDEQTDNTTTQQRGQPESARQSFTGQRQLRKTADPRAGAFLRKLTSVRASRILVSTRLYPRDLQDPQTDDPLPGSYPYFLLELSDNDAVDLWRSFDVSGSRAELLSLFHSFDNHPLLIKALAGEVKRYKRARGNFDEWRKNNQQFDPSRFPALKETQAHVLDYALRGLDVREHEVLHTAAGFRMPTDYDTLHALLCGEGHLFASDSELDAALTELEDRGLLGWNKRANRYDLHPIVRDVVWSGLGEDTRRGVYTNLHAHFEALPMIKKDLDVKSLEDLTPAIELYGTLVGLGLYDDALNVFRDRLNSATLWRLSASRQRVEFLEMLFPDGLEQLPPLNNQQAQAYTFNALAQGHQLSGQPGRATRFFRRSNLIYSEKKSDENLSVGLRNLSYALRLSGVLNESECAARRALVITRQQNDRHKEPISLQLLGLTLALRGIVLESETALNRSLRMYATQYRDHSVGMLNSYHAQRGLWFGEFAVALSFADRAWELAGVLKLERDFIRAARLQGEAALGTDDFATTYERLHHALTRARTVNLVEEELPALVALGELRRRQKELKAAREFLDDVWEMAERGPFPIVHADACNVLAQIERDEGNHEKAVEAATKAFQLAWCDGPPFAYHWGLEEARKHLQELGAQEPKMPPFDESKFEPMPEVEVDPEDEFHAGKNAGD